MKYFKYTYKKAGCFACVPAFFNRIDKDNVIDKCPEGLELRALFFIIRHISIHFNHHQLVYEEYA